MAVWWAYFWRHLLYGGVAVFVAGFLVGLAGQQGNRFVLFLSSLLALIPVQVCVLGIVLHKDFRRFSIRFVPSPLTSPTRAE